MQTDHETATRGRHDIHWRRTATARSVLRLAAERAEPKPPAATRYGGELTPLPIGSAEASWLASLGRARTDPAVLQETLARWRFHLAAADLGLNVDREVVDGLVEAIRLGTVLGALRPASDRDSCHGKISAAMACPDHGHDHLAAVLSLCIELDAIALDLDPTGLAPL